MARVELNILHFNSVDLVVSKILDVEMALLQMTIFQGLAVTILSRLIQYIHIQGFIFEALHHSAFFVHSQIILLASQKAVIGLVYSINSMMNLKVAAFVLVIPFLLFSFMTPSFNELQIATDFLLSSYLYLCS